MSNYACSDLYCASFLSLSGAELDSIDRSDPKRHQFIFSSAELDLQKLADDFFFGKKVLMSPQDLFSHAKKLKQSLYR